MISEPVAIVKVSKSRRIEYTRSSITVKPVSHSGRTKLPEHLRREEIVLDPDHLPASSKKIGQEETEQLKCVPAELYAKKYIRPKYLLSTNENETA